MTTLPRLAALAILPILALGLAGCAPGTGSDGSAGGSDGESAESLDCSTATTAGYDLFIEPRLTIDPQQDVYSLDAGDSIAFTDVPEEGAYTTYSYSLAYIDDAGTVFPSAGNIFVGAEDTSEWTLDGPITPTGITGGPYPAFVDIEATTGDGTTVIARICAILPAS